MPPPAPYVLADWQAPEPDANEQDLRKLRDFFKLIPKGAALFQLAISFYAASVANIDGKVHRLF